MKRFILALLLAVPTLLFAHPPTKAAPMGLLYESKVPAPYRAAFVAQVNEMAGRLKVKPDWLMVVMCFESAGTFRPDIKNPYSGAVGFIQFTPYGIRRLDTSVRKLGRMGAVEQLIWVERYFAPYAGQMHNVYDVYIVVFAPAYLGKPEHQVLYRADGATALDRRRYRYNRQLDSNRDGVITIADVRQQIRRLVPANI
ncbi:transglycosylase SLT domain-containing protein [Spirosoma litoris]